MLIIGTWLAVSCLDDSVRDFGQGPIVVQFKTAAVTPTITKTGNVVDYAVPVVYYGGDNTTFSESVTVTVAVHSTSTAKEGAEFTIPNKTVTIPAGTNTADVVLKINTAALNTATTPKVVLQITEASKAISTANYLTTVNIKSK